MHTATTQVLRTMKVGITGWGAASDGGGIVVLALTEHVARKLHADAQIMKKKWKIEESKGKGKTGKPPKATPKGGAT